MQGRRWLAQRTHPPFAPRKDAVSVVDTYQYPDPEDTFSREPFVVKFSAPSSGEAPPPPQTPPLSGPTPSDTHPRQQLPRSWCWFRCMLRLTTR